jgi:hypothetical protein
MPEELVSKHTFDGAFIHLTQQEFKILLKIGHFCISLGTLKSEIPPNCVSSPIGHASTASLGLLSFWE